MCPQAHLSHRHRQRHTLDRKLLQRRGFYHTCAQSWMIVNSFRGFSLGMAEKRVANVTAIPNTAAPEMFPGRIIFTQDRRRRVWLGGPRHMPWPIARKGNLRPYAARRNAHLALHRRPSPKEAHPLCAHALLSRGPIIAPPRSLSITTTLTGVALAEAVTARPVVVLVFLFVIISPASKFRTPS